MSAPLSTPGATSAPSVKAILATTTGTALTLKKSGAKVGRIGQRVSKRFMKRTFSTRVQPNRTNSNNAAQAEPTRFKSQQHSRGPQAEHNSQLHDQGQIPQTHTASSTSTRQASNMNQHVVLNHSVSHSLSWCRPQHNALFSTARNPTTAPQMRPTTRFFSTQQSTQSATTKNGYLTKEAAQNRVPFSSAGLLSAFGPSGALASSALYLNITNDNGETIFTKTVQLPAGEHNLGSDQLALLSDATHSNTKYTQIRSRPGINNTNDSDDEDHVIVVEIDQNTHLPTDARFTTKRKHFSLDTINRLSTETDGSISAADRAYASAQSATTQTSSSSGSSKQVPAYGVAMTTSTLPSKHYQSRATTTNSSQSSHTSLTSATDISDLEKDDFDPLNPGIIGAPPSDFTHPLDIKHSATYKFFFGLRRFCTILWTFMPFIRHYVWTHQLHTPTAADRAKMLDNLSKCIEQSGCAFIKFGQWLSMRPDIFPQDVIEVLSRLRDGAPAHEFEETRAIILEEFGMDINELFSSFDAKPVASGSIAQVYRGKLRPERVAEIGLRDAKGNLLDEVAVKIRHPGVLKETWIDLDIIYAIVDHVPGLCIPFNKAELKLMIQYQIDFRFEGHYLSRFRHNFREEVRQGYIAFPYVSPNSLRQSVLIESWANGQTVGDIFTEVGDLFRPIVKITTDALPHANTAPIHHYPPTLTETLREASKSLASTLNRYATNTVYVATTMKSFGIDAIYSLADAFKVNIDSFNRKHNYDYPASQPQSQLGKFLQSVLPPRGRVGEEKYVWDPKLSDEENLRAEQKKILAYTLFDMFAKMFLRDNLIHADLHAGNVLYDHKSFKHTATVLDAGMTVALESDIMSQFELFLRAVCYGDPNSLVEACSRFEVNLPNASELSLLPPLPNDRAADFAALPVPNGSGVGLLATNSAVRDRFHHDINIIFQKFYGNSNIWGADESDNVSIGDVVGQVLLTMQTHGVILRGDVAASIMAMSVIEGLLRQLDPELDIVLNCLPYFIRYKRQTR